MADNKREVNIRSALAVSSFLPYTMSWIYRQVSDPLISPVAVIAMQRENGDLFPFNNVYLLKDEPYYKKVIKAKLGFWFGRRPVHFKTRIKKSVKETLTRHTIQLVHAHFGTFGIYFMESCAELNIPLLITFHGFDISSA